MTREKEIEAVWKELNILPTGQDMSNECRLAAVLIKERESRIDPGLLDAASRLQRKTEQDALERLEEVRTHGSLRAQVAFFQGLAAGIAIGILAAAWSYIIVKP